MNGQADQVKELKKKSLTGNLSTSIAEL
jgi:hypothetical protein